MDESIEDNKRGAGSGRETALVIIAVLYLLGAMAAYVYYPFPNGKHPDLASFVGFWLRELLILGSLAVAAVAVVVAWVIQSVRRLLGLQ